MLAILPASFAQGTLVDKVLAVVGDNIILESDVEAQYQQLAAQAQSTPLPADERCILFDNLLLDKLFLSQAQIDSVTASPEEVDAERNNQGKVGKCGNPENLFWTREVESLQNP